MPAEIRVINMTINNGGTSEKVTLSTTSAQSAAYDAPSLLVLVDTASYARAGTNPTALGTGVDQYLPANIEIRVAPWIPGNKLAIIALAGTGNAYITPSV